jgi:hypothetical protein
MEGGDRASDVEMIGGVVSAELAALGHEAIRGLGDGVIDGGNVADPVGQLLPHPHTLRQNCLDETVPAF